MNTQDKNRGTGGQGSAGDRDMDRLRESDLEKSERDLRPRPGRTKEPFPASQMNKDQRKDVERARHGKKDDEDLQRLADEIDGTVGSRQTGSSPEDIAGVADLDRGMRRARRNK